MFEGYKTYITAVLAFAGAAYFLSVGNTERAYELFLIALGLVGLRSAIATSSKPA